MYSVFIVDDEMLVREGLRSKIDWEHSAFTFAGEAGDGEIALSMIQDIKPDILITDIRMPFMDHRMVTLGMSLPWKSRLHGGFSKSIIRDAMAPFMPKEIAYRRTKIGFNTPIVEWM